MESSEACTLALLFLTYAGTYGVRVPLLVSSGEFKADAGVSQGAFGRLLAAGYAAYFLGKLAAGRVTDRVGGRAALLGAVVLSAAGLVAFSWGNSTATFTGAWVFTRGVMPMAWVGLVKVAAACVPRERRGKAMAALSLSFMAGDATARALLAALVDSMPDWRERFRVCAASAVAAAVPAMVGLRGAGAGAGAEAGAPADSAEEPERAHEAAHGAGGPTRTGRFALLCALSFCLTMVRDTMHVSSVVFLQALGASASRAAGLSALFPLAGIASSLAAGTLVDAVPERHRFCVPALFCLPLAGVLWGMARTAAGASGASVELGAALVAAVGFTCSGPYTLLAGTYAIDIGGVEGAARASATIDAVGYAGAVGLMMYASTDPGLSALLELVAGLAALATVAGLGLWWLGCGEREYAAVK